MIEIRWVLVYLAMAGVMVSAAGEESREGATAGPEEAASGRLHDVEADVVACTTAAEAVLVYRLFLADASLPADVKAVAEWRLQELEGLADEHKARVGEAWGTAVEAAQVASQAQDEVDHALELMRLGNGTLAKESLAKAARLDPRNGRAAFATGLAYLKINDVAKARTAFAEAVDAEMNNGPAINNLAVCELQLRRPVQAAEHYRRAAHVVADLQPIANNVALAIRMAATPRGKMPAKPLEEFNALLRWLGRDRGVEPVDAVTSFTILTWDGRPCLNSQGEIAEFVPRDIPCAAAGIVVAAEHVLVPAGLVRSGWDVAVANPADALHPFPARVVAQLDRLGVALIRCDGLQAPPFPLATAAAAVGEEVTAVSGGGSVPANLWELCCGPVLTPPEGGLFMHGAAVARGLGGGAVVEPDGRIVGMIAALPHTGSIGLARGFAIAIDDLWPFLKEHIPNLEAAEPTNPLDRKELTSRMRQSTVSVLQVKPAPQP
jgi:Flp pilus assembly protein TadD